MSDESKVSTVIRAVLENGDTCSCEPTIEAPSVWLRIGFVVPGGKVSRSLRVRDWIKAAYELGRADQEAEDRGSLQEPCASDTSQDDGSRPATKFAVWGGDR